MLAKLAMADTGKSHKSTWLQFTTI